jgi:hypothetical protein
MSDDELAAATHERMAETFAKGEAEWTPFFPLLLRFSGHMVTDRPYKEELEANLTPPRFELNLPPCPQSHL